MSDTTYGLILSAEKYRCYVGDEITVIVRLPKNAASEAKSVELTVASAFRLQSKPMEDAEKVSENQTRITYRLLRSWFQPDKDRPDSTWLDVKLVAQHGLNEVTSEKSENNWMRKVGEAVAASIEVRVDAMVARICIGVFSSSRYMRYLPGLYAQDDLLGRLLLVAEHWLQPREDQIANLDLYFDPRQTTDDMLRWLAETWLGVRWDERWEEKQRRRLIAKMFDLYRSRGTKRGLQWMLYLALPADWADKSDVDVTDDDLERFVRITEYIAEDMKLGPEAVLGLGTALGREKLPHTFDVRVKVPPGEESKWSKLKPELERIVASEKPAHTVCCGVDKVNPLAA
jgi:phage tail-like protein